MKFTPKNIVIGLVILVLAALVVVQTTTDYDLLKMIQKQDAEQNAPTQDENTEGGEAQVTTLVEGEPCVGTAINVAYSYPHPTENFTNPWECEVQCKDQVQRYISYTNGTATQCEKVPGCLDLGEDKAVTCTPSDAE
jgi:hypothetical protein